MVSALRACRLYRVDVAVDGLQDVVGEEFVAASTRSSGPVGRYRGGDGVG